ncbi:MAG: response regulator transcription factor [Lachnospiraceae bacterium]|nr:response regulator transcription factor [Lachnospiraceae bacterium]
MQKILIVEDDIIICGGIKIFLESKGYKADCAYSLADAENALSGSYNLIVLDINLPDGNGLDLCSKLHNERQIPVIFLSANDTDEDMIKGFKAGCDDYIAKPFSTELLNQRIMAVLRRAGQNKENDLFQYKDMSVDFRKMQVYINNTLVKLSVTEYKLLELLIKNMGQVLTRETIIERIWDCDENFIDGNTLNVHIRRLRQKLEPDGKNPQYIRTVFGIGYTYGD